LIFGTYFGEAIITGIIIHHVNHVDYDERSVKCEEKRTARRIDIEEIDHEAALLNASPDDIYDKCMCKHWRITFKVALFWPILLPRYNYRKEQNKYK